MTGTIFIYGRSDDLIEIGGGIQEELYADYGKPTTIQFDNGDTFVVEYTREGTWQIEQDGELNNSMGKAQVLDVGAIESLCEYSEVVVYQPWDDVSEVEKL